MMASLPSSHSALMAALVSGVSSTTPDTSQMEIFFSEPWHRSLKRRSHHSESVASHTNCQSIPWTWRPSYSSLTPHFYWSVQATCYKDGVAGPFWYNLKAIGRHVRASSLQVTTKGHSFCNCCVYNPLHFSATPTLANKQAMKQLLRFPLQPDFRYSPYSLGNPSTTHSLFYFCPMFSAMLYCYSLLFCT